MKPFLKWAGNKYRVLRHIREVMPQGGRLIEPFCGSCAVSLNVDHAEYILNDRNTELVQLYEMLRIHGESFIEYCQSLFTEATNHPDIYYSFRTEFNETYDAMRRSALFLYLNRHGYNGLYRTNRRGKYNVPFGRYNRPYFPAREMRYFHQRFKHARFTQEDFEVVMNRARPGDLVYADPPYVPLTATANFTGYQAGGFSEEEQVRLACAARSLAAKGVHVLISNHDTPLTREIYQGAEFSTFAVQRLISRDSKNRVPAQEILALFRPESQFAT